MCGAVSRCQNSLSRLLRHLTRPMMGNISCLFWANQILAQVPPRVSVSDKRSRLLIRSYEKQQVDVRKVINHSANMACCRPHFSFFILCVYRQESLVDMHPEQMHMLFCASHSFFRSTSFSM